MQMTHFGHSCLLVETTGARLLIDPGTLSQGFEEVRDLDAILVTHQHPDHVDEERFAALAGANPGARILVEPAVRDIIARAGVDLARVHTLTGEGEGFSVGGLQVHPVGAQHAVIHRDIPRIGNTGFVVRAEGEPALYHPGDAIDTVPEGVDVLAAPINAPWCALKETVDWVREVAPTTLVPIHDATLAAPGRQIYLSQLMTLGAKTPEGEDRDGGMGLVDLAGKPATAIA